MSRAILEPNQNPMRPGVTADAAPGIGAPEQLASAFALFNDLSEQLSCTYRAMEERVGELNSELHTVAEQRLAELRENERLTSRLRGLLALLPAGVMVLDGAGRITEANPAALELLGEPLVGERWSAVIGRAFAPRSDDGHEISLHDGRRVSLATRSLDAEPGQLILLTDQTETRALQQRLSRHQRLSEMGRMLSSLAHQIRTPLAAATLYAGHLAEVTEQRQLAPAKIRRFASKILDRLNHLERQVRDMLIFIRGDVQRSEVLTAEELAERLEAASEAAIALAGAACTLHLSDPAAQVLCHSDSVLGALTNMVENGLQAAGADARIEIELGSDREWLRIAVSDSGPGLDRATLARLEEPFFTTKPQGSGLGLAVVRAVAEAHRGHFELANAPAGGGRACLYLPRWYPAAAPSPISYADPQEAADAQHS